MFMKKSLKSVIILISLLLTLTAGLASANDLFDSPYENENEELLDMIDPETEELPKEDFKENEDGDFEITDLTLQSLNELSVSNVAIEQFVTRLYKEILGRNPEPGGFAHWTNELIKGTPGATVAHGFFFSNQFHKKPFTPDQCVEIHYRTLLNRNPESGVRTY